MAMGLVIANRSALFQYSVIIIVNNWYCTNATQNLVDDIGSSFCNLHFSVHRRWRTDPLRQQQLQKNTPQIRSQEIWIRRSIIVIFLIWGILKWTIPVLFFVNFNFFLKRTICPSSIGWWDSNHDLLNVSLHQNHVTVAFCSGYILVLAFGWRRDNVINSFKNTVIVSFKNTCHWR